ncbi:hypothetical protein [uncultured Lactobacillus sp.]|uniref:hypothetical protein n=1 Tax=uncultured Lactobacillus sp. TaxID=153152 RepID=UPI002632FF25|nr:hypothetical protein [uncultured Lactobacillus sp.]
MSRINENDRDRLLGKYKSDIYLMLVSLGVKEASVTALMKYHEASIERAFGPTRRAPIVTAQLAARQIYQEKWTD